MLYFGYIWELKMQLVISIYWLQALESYNILIISRYVLRVWFTYLVINWNIVLLHKCFRIKHTKLKCYTDRVPVIWPTATKLKSPPCLEKMSAVCCLLRLKAVRWALMVQHWSLLGLGFRLFIHSFVHSFIYKAHLKTTQGWPKCCTDQEAQI